LDAVRPWLADIATEIVATQRYARRSQVSQDAKPVLICGDLAVLPQIDQVLATLIDTPVARWCYAGQSRPGSAQTAATDTNADRFAADAAYAVAFSLAHTAVTAISPRSKP
jgi:hypothetical protein